MVRSHRASNLHRYGDMVPQKLDRRTDGRSGDFMYKIT